MNQNDQTNIPPLPPKEGLREKITRIKKKYDAYQLFFYEWVRGFDRKISFIIFCATAVVLAFISIPDSLLTSLPTEKSDVGKTMKYTVRAERNYEIINKAQTEKDKLKAASSVPLYFDYINLTSFYRKTEAAFSSLPVAVDTLIEEKFPHRAHSFIPEEFQKLYLYASLSEHTSEQYELIKKEQKTLLKEKKKEFEKSIGVAIPDIVYQLLVDESFSPDILAATFELINRLQKNFLIYRAGLPKDYTLENIIIHRGDIYARRPASAVISDTSLIPELRHAQIILRQDERFTIKGLMLIESLAALIIRDNINLDIALTDKKKEEAESLVPNVVFVIKAGEIIRRAGEPITAKDIQIFSEIAKESNKMIALKIFICNLLYILFSIGIAFFAFSRSVSKFSHKNKDIILMATLSVIVFFLWEALISLSIPFSHWIGSVDARVFYFFLPFPFAIALVRMLINTETALFFLLCMLIILLTIFPDDFSFPAYYCIGSLLLLYLITHIETMSSILKISLLFAIIFAAAAFIIFLMDDSLPSSNLPRALLLSVLGSILNGLLIMGMLPLWEWWLGYTTDVRFLEYSSLNHPLLKELAVKANGTYQHSLAVGLLVEAAAREIGLSPLACKVMAYFHDIGKLHKPLYFSENQAGKNKHDDLNPSMSLRVILDHARYGNELVRRHRLGEKIEDSVNQHHGTSIVKYFYEKAKEENPGTSDTDYRYPGPKPKSRETGLIMLGDSVEAAIRSIPEKDRTYQKIADGVHNIINRIVNDGQLSECNMTMKDLAKIEQSFITTLIGMYHPRTTYKEPVA